MLTESERKRGCAGRRGRRPLRVGSAEVLLLTEGRREEGALLIHRSAVPLLRQEKAKVRSGRRVC